MDHKAFISQLEVFEINSSVVGDGFHLPLTSPADPYFLRGHTKQKTGIISAHSVTEIQMESTLVWFEACLWTHSVD